MHEWYIREDEIGANYAVFYASITIFFVIAGPLAYFRLFTTEQSLGVFGDGLMQTIPYMFGALFWVIYWGASLVCGLTAITIARVMKEGAGAYIRASMPSCPGTGHRRYPESFPHRCRQCGEDKLSWCPRKDMCALCCWHTRDGE